MGVLEKNMYIGKEVEDDEKRERRNASGCSEYSRDSGFTNEVSPTADLYGDGTRIDKRRRRGGETERVYEEQS